MEHHSPAVPWTSSRALGRTTDCRAGLDLSGGGGFPVGVEGWHRHGGPLALSTVDESLMRRARVRQANACLSQNSSWGREEKKRKKLGTLTDGPTPSLVSGHDTFIVQYIAVPLRNVRGEGHAPAAGHHHEAITKLVVTLVIDVPVMGRGDVFEIRTQGPDPAPPPK